MIWLLVIVFFTTGEPDVESGFFDNASDCQIEERRMLTKALPDDKVLGWVVQDECTPIQKASKT